MAYIGRNLEQFSNVEKLDNITFTNSAGPYNLLKSAVAFTPANAQSLLIEVDGVIQSSDSYTVSLSTITFGVSMASTSTMNSIIHLGVGLISIPADGTVTNDKLGTDISATKITVGTLAEARLPASALGAVWESKSADFTAEARKNYFVDTTGGAVDVTLPSGTIGDTVRFLDVSGTFDTNDLTVLNGSSKIQGASANLDVSTERAGFALVYYNSTQGWLLEDK